MTGANRLRVSAAVGAGMGLCALAALLLRAALTPPPLRTPFPGAALLSERAWPAWPARLTVTREYVAAASHREVVEWYRGKDSLTPLPAVMWSGCSQHVFERRQNPVDRLVGGRLVEETVTVCPRTGAITITSRTTILFLSLIP